MAKWSITVEADTNDEATHSDLMFVTEAMLFQIEDYFLSGRIGFVPGKITVKAREEVA